MTLEEVIKKLSVIRKSGFIKTHRSNDTGIGKTLEDLLGIAENNLSLPDIGELELKAKRIESNSMLTIVTKSPQPRGANRVLFDNYKYKDVKGCFNLHSTVYGSRYNPQGFKIAIRDDKLILENKKNIEIYWPVSIFDSVLKSKSDKILVVFAETKGEKKTENEQFHYIEAHLLFSLNTGKFKNAITNDKLKVDIRIGAFRSGIHKGMYHDHGTGFRINKRDFLELFDNYRQLM